MFELTQYLGSRLQESGWWVLLVTPFVLPLLMLSFHALHLTSLVADVCTLLAYGIVYYVDFSRLANGQSRNVVVSWVHLRGNEKENKDF